MSFDIFQLGNTIEKKFPEFTKLILNAPDIDLAIEDLASAREGLRQIVASLEQLQPGDYENFAQALSDLRGLFEHSIQHMQAAIPQIDRLWKTVSEKAEIV